MGLRRAGLELDLRAARRHARSEQAGDESFKTRFEDLGGEIVGEDTFKQEDQSIDAQVSRITQLSQEPDFLYVSSFQPGFAGAIKQLRDAGIEAPIVGGSDLDGDYWKEALPDVSDVYFPAMASIYGDDPDQEVNDLLATFEEESGAPPDVSAFLGGYAAVQAIQEAVTQAGSTDGEEMTAVMEEFTDEPFVLETTFTPEFHISLERTVRIMKHRRRQDLVRHRVGRERGSHPERLTHR